ncbi:U11/U12 small nuclear ribonucleoprotein 25 kDa protein-like [Palaemon carinicauda]|uniref:U11/U12 small nuclear ribonucleoprotein 25 kDa protein-like n=1 Tax=Palaemon carinicauda TaxID=392227 RepID=UPI0035B60855
MNEEVAKSSEGSMECDEGGESSLKAEENPTKDVDEGASAVLSHAELKAFFQGALERLLPADPVLNDLHPQVTLEEVQALIDLEHGQAMKVYIKKADGGYWNVVVPREATVHELKVALKHHVALWLNRKGLKKKISWRYIWKTNWLCFDKEKLINDNCKLLEYGIRNKSTLTFLKKRRDKQRVNKRSDV